MNPAQSSDPLPSWSGNGRTAPSDAAGHSQVQHTVAEIVKLEQRDRLAMSWSDHLANWTTAFSGSMLFVGLHVVWFALWVLINLGWLGIEPFDPFPFGLLTMVVSLEAIFLSTFVLISQNRQALQADRRAKVDLQVNLIAEQEVTKVMQMVAEIHDHLGIRHARDPELYEMQQPTRVTRLMDAIDAAEQQLDPEGAKGPDSAVDTEA